MTRARPPSDSSALASSVAATRRLRLHAPAALLALAALPRPAPAQPRTSNRFQVAEFAMGLANPWAIAFLPDGQMLVTERVGRLRRVSAQGQVSAPIGGLPAVHARGQGGLLDVIASPQFASDGLIYFGYAEAADGGARTAVARGRLDGNQLRDVRVIFRQTPAVNTTRHFGCRLVFSRDGLLFITLGDRGDFSERAQDLTSHIGKIVRIHPDGRVPRDNPYIGQAGALPELWSIGHRNVQGAGLHPQTGELWTHEHGARGGDEINIARAGKNYGWPVITHGVNYSGSPIGVGPSSPGLEPPLLHWTPSIAPSGMAFVTSDRYPGWQGNLLVGSLKDQLLVRVELDGERVTSQENLLTTTRKRIRDVRMGPDGLVYLATDESDGQILRLEPQAG